MPTKVLLHRVKSLRAVLIAGLSAIVLMSTGVQRAEAFFQLGSASAESKAAGRSQLSRIVITLERAVTYKVYARAGPSFGVIIDLPAVRFNLPQSAGIVKSVRGGFVGAGKARIEINLKKPVVVNRSYIVNGQGKRPSLLVIEVKTTDRSTFLAGLTLRPLRALSAPSKLGGPLPRGTKKRRTGKPSERPVIVLDPGHGGRDSGAKKNGTVEKNVVLSFAKALRKILEASGYTVVMTRDKDVFVSLNGRRAIAEKQHADLFLAIHADYVRRKSVRGATVYTLYDSRHDRYRRKGQSWSVTGVERSAFRRLSVSTRAILQELNQRKSRHTKARAQFLADSVVQLMTPTTLMKQQPHRRAAFRVINTSKVPSALIELAYVTNKKDAANLRSRAWQKKVASSIARAVERYFNYLKLPLN